ncbi:MAG TPA: HepT-like ribonuclease domain-containing protein [Stellaceae bacterium]
MRRSANDILAAIGHISSEMAGVTIDTFEADWRKRWLVERGSEIISAADRHLTDELKCRHPEMPWAKVAGIENVLRHEYEGVAPPVLWKLAQDGLTPLEQVCSEELARGQSGEGSARR